MTMKAVDNYSNNGKKDHGVRGIMSIQRKMAIADQMDLLHICIYAHTAIDFVDLVKPIGEEDDHQ